MRRTTHTKPFRLVPRNRRAYAMLVAEQALTRTEVLAAREADVTPKQRVLCRAA